MENNTFAFKNDTLTTLQATLNQREYEYLLPVATKSCDSIRKRHENIINNDYRQSFSVDADRIIASRAYTRYIDKTQVFSLIKNDHITHRVLHVQLVSKIARTVGRFLRLNEDLIESIALGHDIGHPPFGHDGEKILSELCIKHGAGHFRHNIQSVQSLEKIERNGTGWNLSLQTLDGIFCHNGEIHNMCLKPVKNKTFNTLEQDMKKAQKHLHLDFIPMTMEGCVVRMADTISYVGRDFEDALRLNLIKKTELPTRCLSTLGDSNGKIVYALVTDLIENSLQKPYIRFSQKISDVLKELKDFNLQRIYLNKNIKPHLKTIENLFENLFERYLHDLEKENFKSRIYINFLDNLSDAYKNSHSNCEITRDFIAGMTDNFFLEQFPVDSRPEITRFEFK